MSSTIPFFPYKLFFIYIEPVSALAGAYYSHFEQTAYLQDLSLSSQPWPSAMTSVSSVSTSMVLTQLANLYLLFALNECLVLSSTNSMTTWKRLLFGLLVADFGHLYSMKPLGLEAFWNVREWNAMLWGSIGFVYLGATMRTCFLLGVGVGGGGKKKTKW